MADRPPVNAAAAVVLVLAVAVGASVVALSVGYAVHGTSVYAGNGQALATGLGAILGAVLTWLGHHAALTSGDVQQSVQQPYRQTDEQLERIVVAPGENDRLT